MDVLSFQRRKLHPLLIRAFGTQSASNFIYSFVTLIHYKLKSNLSSGTPIHAQSFFFFKIIITVL